jgi:nitrate reductase gamma subunit
MSTFLWVIVPYLCLADLRRRAHLALPLRQVRLDHPLVASSTRTGCCGIGSPLFHFGMLGVVGGHVIGLLVPKSWTDALGI